MANEITNIITAILSMIPKEVLIGLIVVIALLVMGYENKKKAERAAEEARRRKTRKTGTATKTNPEE